MPRDEILDGRRALMTLVRRAGYADLLEVVAAHAVFLHPDTVRQTAGAPVFKVIRARDTSDRGTFRELGADGLAMLDDNTAPTHAFLWAADCARGTDVVFNHVWAESDDWRCYTALWNLCVTPAFLTKLTDGDASVCRALRRRAWELYGFRPADAPEPEPVAGLGDLPWAAHPPAVRDLEGALRDRLGRSAKSRTAESVRRCGWVFNGFQPEG